MSDLHGLTVHDLARRYRVSAERVRGWIASGALRAVNRRDPGRRPSFVVTAEALADFERGRAVTPAAPPKPTRRKKQTGQVDYYPD
jgi:hypothetical protein